MSAIKEAFPEYGSTRKLDQLRASEYGYLDEQGHVYLDYTGAGLAARAQHRAHDVRLASTTFGNPHSMSPTSQASTDMIELARSRVLAHVGASPEEYAVVFTANATAAIRLVGEAYGFRRGSRLVLTSDNHNSVNGLREYAKHKHARVSYVHARPPELRIDTSDVEGALSRRRRCCGLSSLGSSKKPKLFAYPAQSNFSGVRHPLSWVQLAQQRGYDVLLDAAAYLPTSTLDLSTIRPEFVVVSWYKVLGLPTGVGCLVARRDALARLKRPWFSGGTIRAATVGVPWHLQAGDESGFEDGTLNYLSIPDVHFGLCWLSGIGIDVVATRVRCLTGWLLHLLQELRHSDGTPMATIYGPTDLESRGGTVAFNVIDACGSIVDDRLVAIEASALNISLRTGCFCNPGVGEDAFGVDAKQLQPLIQARTRSFDDFLSITRLPIAGAVRVSFGVASNLGDVEFLVGFLRKTYRDRVTTIVFGPRESC
ncbi:hypothetical protein CDD80_5516 [Ophiocordyceps camponoti-rufipedis]|uniref:Aminotransferase class V domain-containing protein n=1 Tax=Ophiocordyceps camponoti-rufipedis TaxID=2004952 RepID=A0A2C5XTY9_9HYPO|nr:hypothetical protein CDD80_5516 [Ophiocordyceps camponoti-rufipedis]